jgi:hypothetical protein
MKDFENVPNLFCMTHYMSHVFQGAFNFWWGMKIKKKKRGKQLVGTNSGASTTYCNAFFLLVKLKPLAPVVVLFVMVVAAGVKAS